MEAVKRISHTMLWRAKTNIVFGHRSKVNKSKVSVMILIAGGVFCLCYNSVLNKLYVSAVGYCTTANEDVTSLMCSDIGVCLLSVNEATRRMRKVPIIWALNHALLEISSL